MKRSHLIIGGTVGGLLLVIVVSLLIYCLSGSSPPPPDPIPLNMVPEAVDDKYDGCDKEMEKKVNSTYFKEENVGTLKMVWEKCSNKTYPQNKALIKNHMLAICVYTSRYIYKEFNDAVRTNRTIYGSSFRFHSLHFWLTTAIQKLNNNHQCQTTYRKTNVTFTGNVNDIIRFGAFASSSIETNLKDFGNKTCFKIETCSGAYLKNYSWFQDEEEVLIPPYETFKITDIIEGRGEFPVLKDCEKVFVLKSEQKDVSNLNCKSYLNSKATQLMREQSFLFFCLMYLLGTFTVLNINVNI
ncbi:T-cell ecto-ADP-ribosyltransferase 1-like isoform X1 [Thunnus albacares]|uniref:T-cell ecto-ADP-ribosyltransferase 1-like isoform X1 n=2 Tax=Thunnus albacares TaxID=8236 RepID=UPI001CF63B04|nr:T-cell ecto-ADP-ribosyltransferase 1-like isoform X1 [Thunnus albacares]